MAVCRCSTCVVLKVLSGPMRGRGEPRAWECTSVRARDEFYESCLHHDGPVMERGNRVTQVEPTLKTHCFYCLYCFYMSSHVTRAFISLTRSVTL